MLETAARQLKRWHEQGLVLEIDRSLVSGLALKGGTAEALVVIIYHLAHCLGLQTVAEGIETDGIRRRPLLADQLERLLQAGIRV